MIDREHDLPITKQAEILKVSRGSVYYLPRPVSSADLAIMQRLDRLHLEHPFAGSRMLRGLLALQGCKIGRRHVKTLMRRMGIEALLAPGWMTGARTMFEAMPLPLQPRQTRSMDEPDGGCRQGTDIHLCIRRGCDTLRSAGSAKCSRRASRRDLVRDRQRSVQSDTISAAARRVAWSHPRGHAQSGARRRESLTDPQDATYVLSFISESS